MHHRRTAVACLLVSVCLFAGCRAAGGSPGAQDQSAASSGKSISSSAGKANRGDSVPVPPSTNDSAIGELAGEWVLQQVQLGSGSPRSAHPGLTTLLIHGGTLFAVDACSAQLQAQLTVDRSTLQLTGGIYGGGFGGGVGHPCGDPEAVGFWNTNGTIRWAVVHSKLIVTSNSMTLTYRRS